MSILSINELKQLVEQSQCPCVSIYMPTVQAGAETQQNPIRFKNLIRQAEAALQENYQLRHPEVLNLLQPAMDLDQEDFWQHQDSGLAIFAANNFFHYYKLPLDFEESVLVGEQFYLKPLMPLLMSDGRFYLLALSQKQIRLFEGSRYSIREVELEDVPTNMDETLLYDETAKDGQFRISTGKGGTNNSFQKTGNVHGQGSPDRDKPKVDILQFFHRVDEGLQKYLHDEYAPLVLAGVEYLLPIYREANSYQHLVDEIISVENIGILEPNHELHAQVWSIVEPYYTRAQQTAIDQYYELSGSGKTSKDLKEAVAAAYYGRVDQLFVAINVHEWGQFDPQANELQHHSEAELGDEDLLNAAAIQTLLNGGTVYALEPDDVPDTAHLAAIFRY